VCKTDAMRAAREAARWLLLVEPTISWEQFVEQVVAAVCNARTPKNVARAARRAAERVYAARHYREHPEAAYR